MKATSETFRTYLVVGLLVSALILCTSILRRDLLKLQPSVLTRQRSRPSVAGRFTLAGLATPVQMSPQNAIHVIHVDDDAPVGGNGTGQFPFNNLADALALARTTSSGVIIKVAPGDYADRSPLVIDRSMVDLHGSSVLIEDMRVGRPGWLHQAPRHASSALFRSDRSRLSTSVGPIESSSAKSPFVVLSSKARLAPPEVILRRVQDYTVQDNVFLPLALYGVQSIASSGRVAGNYFSGVDLQRSSPADILPRPRRSPSQETVRFTTFRRRALKRRAELDSGARRRARCGRSRQRSEQQHLQQLHWGMRIFIIRRDLGTPGDSQSEATYTHYCKTIDSSGTKLGFFLMQVFLTGLGTR